MKKDSCGVCKVTSWALIVAGLALGIQGLFEWNLFTVLSGESDVTLRVIYVVVGIATIGVIARKMDMCKVCKK
ncbi:DUF378 domain-containing protein [Candidatus Uhrbacteria bacterium]|nr:DUF378 domain-containing protein [Candidatus Uhrbacteria bacterium]